ncbi:hypothetical protein D3C72_2016780 [compost metagenome]
MSTLSSSNHERALVEAMSGLFWWSDETSRMPKVGLPVALKSSIAIFAASTEPDPDRSE